MPPSMHANLPAWFCATTGLIVHALSALWPPLQRCDSRTMDVLLLMAGVEAQLMVPRALTVLESSKSAQQAWLGAWGSISLHVLLPWAAQMLSLLGSSEGAALLPALKVSTGLRLICCRSPLNSMSYKQTLVVFPEILWRCCTELDRECMVKRYVLVHRSWQGGTSSDCTFPSHSASSTTARQATRGLPSSGR